MSKKYILLLGLWLGMAGLVAAGKQLHPTGEEPIILPEQAKDLKYFMIPALKVKGLTADEAVVKVCNEVNKVLAEKNYGIKPVKWEYQLEKNGLKLEFDLANVTFLQALEGVANGCGLELKMRGTKIITEHPNDKDKMTKAVFRYDQSFIKKYCHLFGIDEALFAVDIKQRHNLKALHFLGNENDKFIAKGSRQDLLRISAVRLLDRTLMMVTVRMEWYQLKEKPPKLMMTKKVLDEFLKGKEMAKKVGFVPRIVMRLNQDWAVIFSGHNMEDENWTGQKYKLKSSMKGLDLAVLIQAESREIKDGKILKTNDNLRHEAAFGVSSWHLLENGEWLLLYVDTISPSGQMIQFRK